tara:strand:- start:90 stop:1010 length:921 start_codon:yes stop_codon:yes gene_type:complete
MKNIIVITGGAGFVGSNLIETLSKITTYKLISIDNYSTGSKKNHIKSKKIKYIKGDTSNIHKLLSKYKKKIRTLFHFGEFARIYQSFKNFDQCFTSNSIGTKEVFKFCMDNRIKLIYSATSASIGNRGNDKNLSPYSFTKSKNLELLENLKKWYGFKYEIIYFYNVYGPRQVCKGKMATVIGIFEEHYKMRKSLPVVKPGSQTRRFTHIEDTISTCLEAWKKNMCKHYSISHKESFSLIEVAKLFGSKIKFLPHRPGERYASALTRMNLSNNVVRKYGKISLKDYIISFKNSIKSRKNNLIKPKKY